MSRCVKCGDDQAYVGLDLVECPNPDCEHFSESLLTDYVARLEKPLKGLTDASEDTAPMSFFELYPMWYPEDN